MKKIGLVCATLNNYGSLLQTYALQNIIKNKGVETEIIRFKEPLLYSLFYVRNYELFKVLLKKIILRKVLVLKHKGLINKLASRSHSFDQFRKDKLVQSNICTDRKQLTKLAGQYRLVLLGSDQLWHPMNLAKDYFSLSFVPDNVTRAAYAASFGVSEIPQKLQLNYKKFLNKFDFISCREESGAQIVKSLLGKDVPVVCDPAVLMTADEWMPLLSDKIKPNEKYIFCYFLGSNPRHRDFVKDLKKQLRCKVLALPHIVEFVNSDENYADYLPYNVGPSEFMYLIRNAEFVCTDSFHATVFSLQFHKQFLVFDRFENCKGKSTTSRIETILKVVKQPNRLIRDSVKPINISEIEYIDYSIIDLLLDEFRSESFKYLDNILAL